MFSLVLNIFLLLVVITTEAFYSDHEKIVGGTPLEISFAPHQVALLYGKNVHASYAHVCGGTIISSVSILTAASCVNGTTPRQWNVRAGSDRHRYGGVAVGITTIRVHPGFDRRRDFDVAVLKLTLPFVYGAKIAPAVMANAGDWVGTRAVATATGWGLTSVDGLKSEVLLGARLPIVDHERCRALFDDDSSDLVITDNMLCAGHVDGDPIEAGPCSGDAGGPLIVYGHLFGVASWTSGCRSRGRLPSVWTNVGSVREWIDENM